MIKISEFPRLNIAPGTSMVPVVYNGSNYITPLSNISTTSSLSVISVSSISLTGFQLSSYPTLTPIVSSVMVAIVYNGTSYVTPLSNIKSTTVNTVSVISLTGFQLSSLPVSNTVTSSTMIPVVNSGTSVITPLSNITALSSYKVDSPRTITISPVGFSDAIYYTTNGSTPTELSTLYTGPFIISSTTTIRAISVKNELNPSSDTQITVTVMTNGKPAPPVNLRVIG